MYNHIFPHLTGRYSKVLFKQTKMGRGTKGCGLLPRRMTTTNCKTPTLFVFLSCTDDQITARLLDSNRRDKHDVDRYRKERKQFVDLERRIFKVLIALGRALDSPLAAQSVKAFLVERNETQWDHIFQHCRNNYDQSSTESLNTSLASIGGGAAAESGESTLGTLPNPGNGSVSCVQVHPTRLFCCALFPN